MQAVVKIGASQFLVSENQEIVVDRLPEKDSEFEFRDVLMTIADKEVLVGKPYLSNVAVLATKIADQKGEKVRVFKYKAKSRYRKTRGFRASQTKILIKSVKQS